MSGSEVILIDFDKVYSIRCIRMCCIRIWCILIWCIRYVVFDNVMYSIWCIRICCIRMMYPHDLSSCDEPSNSYSLSTKNRHVTKLGRYRVRSNHLAMKWFWSDSYWFRKDVLDKIYLHVMYSHAMYSIRCIR